MNQKHIPQRDRAYASFWILGLAAGAVVFLALIDPSSALHQRLFMPTTSINTPSDTSIPIVFICPVPESYPLWTYFLIPAFTLLPLVFVHHAWPSRSSYTLAAILCSLPWIMVIGSGFTFDIFLLCISGLAIVWATRSFLPSAADHHMRWRIGGVPGIASMAPMVPSDTGGAGPAEG